MSNFIPNRPLKIGVIGPNGRLGKAISSLHPIFPIDRDTPRQNLPCDVLIDVSTPEALFENLLAKKPIVIGTTGHQDLSIFEQAAKQLPILYAPNFSLGIALLQRCVELAKSFSTDVHIIETHHAEKKDAPSGTALLLARDLPHAQIHSIRSGKIIGEHTLIFNTPEERVTFTHEAHSRDVFARGALAAAHFLRDKPNGLYSMSDLFYTR